MFVAHKDKERRRKEGENGRNGGRRKGEVDIGETDGEGKSK